MAIRKDKDQDRGRLFGRRAALLAGGKILLLSTLVGRMYYLQVVESAKYQKLADDNRINLRLLAPPRGVIYDRHGEILAHNQQNYRVVVVPEQVSDVTLALDALSEVVEVPDFARRRVMREIRRKRSFVPVTIRDNLSWEEVSRIELNATSLPGVQIEVGLTRAYPFGPAISHTLGYVAAVSEQELTGDPMLELPDMRIGKNGVERQHDQVLRGTAGTSQVEVNALGRVIRELNRDDGRPGRALTLTLDMGLQSYANALLANHESASCVCMSIPEGEVLALASHPSYDPVPFGRGLTSQEWQELLHHPRGALNNKAISGQYPPGSTFKMTVALAALESGMVTPSHRVFCTGEMELGDTKFHCYKRGGHGGLEMVEAIARSCDIYFYDLARRLGIDRIAAMARKLGFGAPTDLDVPGERNGLVPSREWKQATMGQSWQQGETINLGIGQGYVLTTPMQLAVMTARVATGLQIKPRITRAVGGVPVDSGLAASLGISPQHLAVVQRGMDWVTNKQGVGTAFKSRITQAGFEMAGKSGSAQVKRITLRDRELKNTDPMKWEWKFRDHALFVAFAPIEAPRYVCAVVVEHGGSGGGVAAPIVRDVLLEAQKRGIMRGSGPRIARADAPDPTPRAR